MKKKKLRNKKLYKSISSLFNTTSDPERSRNGEREEIKVRLLGMRWMRILQLSLFISCSAEHLIIPRLHIKNNPFLCWLALCSQFLSVIIFTIAFNNLSSFKFIFFNNNFGTPRTPNTHNFWVYIKLKK